MKILVIDDNLASRKLLQSYLVDYGTVQTASNGLEAYEAIKLCIESGDRYDLICLDIVMPEMDGRTLLKNIRQLESEYSISDAQKAKIIMTTALDDRMDIIESFNEGCEGYIIKPVDKDHLKRVIEQLALKK